jgi:hypothetical protein
VVGQQGEVSLSIAVGAGARAPQTALRSRAARDAHFASLAQAVLRQRRALRMQPGASTSRCSATPHRTATGAPAAPCEGAKRVLLVDIGANGGE